MTHTAAPNKPPDQPESVGRYQIVEPLGRGAMGVVYRARDTVLDREVAVKVMAAGLAQDEAFRLRFEREARIVARISHPNVVVAYDLGYHTDGSPFIAMELLAGQDLSNVLQTRPLDSDDSAAVALQVLAGLSRAHQREIVHRDVKPANIFITEDGKVKIMDFGVARLAASAVTATGAVLGTAYYMSPEQVSGGRVDGRADIFSVGCVLFEMLAMRRPFEAENMLGILYQIANADPDFSKVSSEGEALVPMLRRALQKDPAHRYPSALEFARDLQRHLRANATSAWARHAADVVELEPDKGSGPVLGTRPGTEADTVLPGADSEPKAATHGLLTHLYHSAPTAAHSRYRNDPSATHVTEDKGESSQPSTPRAHETKGEAPRPAKGRFGLPMATVAGVLALILGAVWWWWPQATSPVPATPSATTAAVPPAQPETDTPAAPATPDTVPPEGTEASPSTRTPAAPAAPAVQATPLADARPSPRQPAPVERSPRATARTEAQAPRADVAPAGASPPPAPEPAPVAVTAPAPAPRIAEDTAPSDAPQPLTPAPQPPPPAQAPPAAAVATPVAAPPVTTPPAAQAPAVTAPPTGAPAPARRSPLKVGTSQGRRFDGRSLPATVRLGFRVEPDSPAPGGRGTVSALLHNGGNATVQVRQIVVTIVSGGKSRSETVPGHTEVFPGQDATVFARVVAWPSEPPWSMEVVVHTRAGETYTNTVRWP